MSKIGEEADRSTFGLAPEDGQAHAYNQEAFRYFLAIERKRSERSNRPFLLLLVELKPQARLSTRLDTATAGKLFSRLWLCLRETDFIGWYTEDRVAGAVLTQRPDMPRKDISRQVRQRVIEMLRESLPPDIVDRLHIRVQQLPTNLKTRS